MPHVDGRVVVRRQKCRLQGDVANVPARHVKAGQLLDVETIGWRRARKYTSPDLSSEQLVGEWEVDHETKATEEGRVKRFLHVGGQDGQTPICLHSLQEVADLDVGVAVVAVLDLAPAPEESVRLVEQEAATGLLGGVEYPAKVLFGLADVLTDDLTQVDPVEVQAEAVGEYLRCECLARSAGTCEQRGDAEPAAGPRGKPPVFIDARAMRNVHLDLTQGFELGSGQHKVVPIRLRIDSLSKLVKRKPGLNAAGGPKRFAHPFLVAHGAGQPCLSGGFGARCPNTRRAELKLGDKPVQLAIENRGRAAQQVLPEVALLSGQGRLGLEADQHPLSGGARLAAAQDQWEPRRVQHPGYRRLARSIASVEVAAVQQKAERG